ncbi:MAG: hypothetical protein ACE5DK_10770 [Paracoccaceae bacterium]
MRDHAKSQFPDLRLGNPTRYIIQKDLTFSEAPEAEPEKLLNVAAQLRSALTG